VEAVRGELPVIARLPFESALSLAPAAIEAGATAVSLSPPRGQIIPNDATGITRGRLYGPGILPQALGLVQQLAELDIPIIGAGGVYSDRQAAAMLAAGALAVQLDACLWRGDYWSN